jgi:hypothetical protein
MVSVIQDYGRARIPRQRWNTDTFGDYKEILKRLESLDAKLGEPDCEDPAKATWMKDVEKRLAALES